MGDLLFWTLAGYAISNVCVVVSVSLKTVVVASGGQKANAMLVPVKVDIWSFRTTCDKVLLDHLNIVFYCPPL